MRLVLYNLDNLSRQIHFGWIENLKYPFIIHLFQNLLCCPKKLVSPFEFQLHGIKRIDLDPVISQMNPNPIITLSARLDVIKVFCQGLQYFVEMVSAEFSEVHEVVLIHGICIRFACQYYMLHS